MPPPEETARNYLRDLGQILKEQALEAKQTALASREGDGFALGRSMAYFEVISLMQNQARVFDMDLRDLGLAGIDPYEDSLSKGR